MSLTLARRSVAVSAVLLAVLTSCSSSGDSQSATDAAAPAETSAAPAEPEPDTTESSDSDSSDSESSGAVPKLLQFTGTTADGAKFDGASLAGKPTVLWFWAPWCPTCRGQIPNVTALAEKYDGKVNVVGIGSLDDAAPIKEFADEVDAMTHLSDPDGKVWQQFGIVEQSVYVVIDASGRMVADGYLSDDELNQTVAELV